jgi:hypothetical protein
MKAYEGVDVKNHIFLTSALSESEWSTSRPGRFSPGEIAHGAHWIGGWVDPRADLDDMEKRKLLTLPGLELRPLGCPARSQSLYHFNADTGILNENSGLSPIIFIFQLMQGRPMCGRSN